MEEPTNTILYVCESFQEKKLYFYAELPSVGQTPCPTEDSVGQTPCPKLYPDEDIPNINAPQAPV